MSEVIEGELMQIADDNVARSDIYDNENKEHILGLIAQIQPPDREAVEAARARWLDLCKPLYALGELENMVIKLAGIQAQARPSADRRAVAVFAADNGVVRQGVTQVGQEVTASVTYNFTRGITTLNAMAKQAGADIFPVDVGINQPDRLPGVIYRRIRNGTADISQEPAMSRDEVWAAMRVGADMADWLSGQDYDLLGAGEMGIGNTTTSSAMLAVFCGVDPQVVTGRGAGLSDDSLLHKQKIISRAIEVNQPDPQDPVDVLSKLGGLDIASLVGFYIGAAASRRAAIIDGFITAVAALTAIRIAPAVRDYIFPSHLSAEPGARLALKEIGLPAWFSCGMRVGEGTGCCVAFDLFGHALAAYNNIATWEEAGIGAYVPQSSTDGTSAPNEDALGEVGGEVGKDASGEAK
jgi:nicotinate-nucleotide--dimethylbenzimidazole phosphoribosyltransferase